MSISYRIPSSVGIGSKQIRFLAIDNNTDAVTFPTTVNISRGSGLRVLFFGSDVMAGTSFGASNHIKVHKRMSGLGYATRLNLQGFRIANISNSGILWFYSIQGVFRVMFEFGTSDMQRDCLLNLTKCWLAHYNYPPLKDTGNLILDSNLTKSLTSPCMEQPVQCAKFYPVPSQDVKRKEVKPVADKIDLVVSTQTSYSSHTQKTNIDTNSTNNLPDIPEVDTCSKANIVQYSHRTDLSNPKFKSTYSYPMSDTASLNVQQASFMGSGLVNDISPTGVQATQVAVGQPGSGLDAQDNRVQACAKKTQCVVSDSGRDTQKQFGFSRHLLEAAEVEYKHEHSRMQLLKGEWCVTDDQNEEKLNTNDTRLEREWPVKTDDQNVEKLKTNEASATAPTSLYESIYTGDKKRRRKNPLNASLGPLEEKIGLLSAEYVQRKLAKKNKCLSLEQRTEVTDCISTSLKYLAACFPSDDDNVICVDLFRVMEEFLNIRNVNLLQNKEDLFDISRSKFTLLEVLCEWLGAEFHQMRTAIEKRVEDFKIQNLYNIDSLPSNDALINMLFPGFMKIFISTWMGCCEREIEQSEATGDHTYPCEREDSRSDMRSRLTQLILELCTNCLISGTAHVVYSQLRIQK